MATESNTDEFLLDNLRRVAKAEGFPDEVIIDVKSETQAGNGFVGVNSFVEMRSKNKVLKLFAKGANKNEKVREQMHAALLFGREIYFYETLFPNILKFQLDRNVERPFDSVCRYYLTSTDNIHETLIFENLKEQGYVQYNKKIDMNEQTITFVFKLYARLHAVSYAMKDQEPELYVKLSENLSDIMSIIFKSNGVNLVIKHYCEEVIQFFDPVKDAQIWERIKNLTEIIMDFLFNWDKIVGYSAIIHGDCWFNNFLFKYKDPNNQSTLEKIKILDWQTVRLGSPVLDLSYFFYGIATKSTLDQLDMFLKTYYDTLSESIREMGSDPKVLYPYSIFREQWKQFSRYGLFASLTAQRLLLTENYDVPNPIEIIEAGGNWGDAFMNSFHKNERYEKRMREIIEHFVHNNFI